MLALYLLNSTSLSSVSRACPTFWTRKTVVSLTQGSLPFTFKYAGLRTYSTQSGSLRLSSWCYLRGLHMPQRSARVYSWGTGSLVERIDWNYWPWCWFTSLVSLSSLHQICACTGPWRKARLHIWSGTGAFSELTLQVRQEPPSRWWTSVSPRRVGPLLGRKGP